VPKIASSNGAAQCSVRHCHRCYRSMRRAFHLPRGLSMPKTVAWRTARQNACWAGCRAIRHFARGWRASSEPSDPYVGGVDQNPDQSANEGPVDTDILKVITDRIFQPIGNRLRIPTADRVGDEAQRRLAIAVDRPDNRAPRIAVERALDCLVFP